MDFTSLHVLSVSILFLLYRPKTKTKKTHWKAGRVTKIALISLCNVFELNRLPDPDVCVCVVYCKCYLLYHRYKKTEMPRWKHYVNFKPEQCVLSTEPLCETHKRQQHWESTAWTIQSSSPTKDTAITNTLNSYMFKCDAAVVFVLQFNRIYHQNLIHDYFEKIKL